MACSITQTPYADWLEKIIQEIMKQRPDRIGVCMLLPNGNAVRGYYGPCDYQDKAIMGYQMNLDATMEVVEATYGLEKEEEGNA